MVVKTFHKRYEHAGKMLNDFVWDNMNGMFVHVSKGWIGQGPHPSGLQYSEGWHINVKTYDGYAPQRYNIRIIYSDAAKTQKRALEIAKELRHKYNI